MWKILIAALSLICANAAAHTTKHSRREIIGFTLRNGPWNPSHLCDIVQTAHAYWVFLDDNSHQMHEIGRSIDKIQKGPRKPTFKVLTGWTSDGRAIIEAGRQDRRYLDGEFQDLCKGSYLPFEYDSWICPIDVESPEHEACVPVTSEVEKGFNPLSGKDDEVDPNNRSGYIPLLGNQRRLLFEHNGEFYFVGSWFTKPKKAPSHLFRIVPVANGIQAAMLLDGADIRDMGISPREDVTPPAKAIIDLGSFCFTIRQGQNLPGIDVGNWYDTCKDSPGKPNNFLKWSPRGDMVAFTQGAGSPDGVGSMHVFVIQWDPQEKTPTAPTVSVSDDFCSGISHQDSEFDWGPDASGKNVMWLYFYTCHSGLVRWPINTAGGAAGQCESLTNKAISPCMQGAQLLGPQESLKLYPAVSEDGRYLVTAEGTLSGVWHLQYVDLGRRVEGRVWQPIPISDKDYWSSCKGVCVPFITFPHFRPFKKAPPIQNLQ